MHGYSIHDDCVRPVFEWAEQDHRAVFVHCGVLSVGVRGKLGLQSPFDMRFSNPIDLHAVALRYPSVPIIVPHFGAGYFREALMLADLCPNVYLDTSSSNRVDALPGIAISTCGRCSGARWMWWVPSGCCSARIRRHFREAGTSRFSTIRRPRCTNSD